MSLSKKPETFEGLRDLMLMKQLLDGLPVELSTFIHEREPDDVDQAAVLAQQYADARKAWKSSSFRREQHQNQVEVLTTVESSTTSTSTTMTSTASGVAGKPGRRFFVCCCGNC
jgi:hypothetical protein